MRAGEQLDLFWQSADPVEQHPAAEVTRSVIACDTLDDNGWVAALLNAGMRERIALAAEVVQRRLVAAIPALEALCRRFAGFDADRVVPEQAAALDALSAIGGSDAAQAVARLIAKGVVRGPSLQRAVSAAARLRAKLPAALMLKLLQHGDPLVS